VVGRASSPPFPGRRDACPTNPWLSRREFRARESVNTFENRYERKSARKGSPPTRTKQFPTRGALPSAKRSSVTAFSLSPLHPPPCNDDGTKKNGDGSRPHGYGGIGVFLRRGCRFTPRGGHVLSALGPRSMRPFGVVPHASLRGPGLDRPSTELPALRGPFCGSSSRRPR
jgi:hypothetical protein